MITKVVKHNASLCVKPNGNACPGIEATFVASKIPYLFATANTQNRKLSANANTPLSNAHEKRGPSSNRWIVMLWHGVCTTTPAVDAQARTWANRDVV